MSRSSWNIYELESGDTWALTDTIYRPNENTTMPILSTQQKVQLADGSYGFMSPETKYVREPIEFIWTYVDDTFKTKIENYVKNATYIKIVDHNSAEYIGRFISVQRIWLTGVDDTYDFSAVFEIME